ncbi:metalloendopeptidase [Rhodotorula paludigena]|uniref:metalloendopeptidase n=1 Tax=Rhodotorula paludigena TaxID=86838 RepID=UPI00317BDAFC
MLRSPFTSSRFVRLERTASSSLHRLATPASAHTTPARRENVRRASAPIHDPTRAPVALLASCRPFSTSPHPAAYRRFGDPPRARGPPPGAPVDPKQVFDLLRAAGAGSQGSWSSARGRPGLHNVQAYLRSPIFVILVAGGGTYYVLHLEKVPETGRWRFIDVSPAMEVQMGDQGYEEVMREYNNKVLPDWHPQARYVQGVVKRIIRANGLEEKLGPGGWKTHVVKEDGTRNAFVLPNGNIFVFTGIMSVANDEDSLACVLGHEIAHQVARHSAERMSGMKVFYGLALLLSSFGIDMGLSQVLLNFVYSLPNSRKNETEADLIGLRLANAACFDPRAAEGLWQRMSSAEHEPGIDMSFLSTHPSSQHRTKQVREWAEQVIQDRPSDCGPLRGQVAPFQRASGSRW